MSIWNDKRHNLNVAAGAWRQSWGNGAHCFATDSECLLRERETESEGEREREREMQLDWTMDSSRLSFFHLSVH